MVGIPKRLLTKRDYVNAVNYANSTGSDKSEIISALNGLKTCNKINVLKKSSEGKPAEEQTPEDYEAIDDPSSEMVRLGFTVEEINALVGRLL